MIHAFRNIVQQYPNHPAIVTDGRVDMTYRQLDALVMNIAAALKTKGIGPGTLVAISLEKSWEYIAALLGTWAAGGAFMPLPPGLPPERRAFQLSDAKPNIIIDDISTFIHKTDNIEFLPSRPNPDDLAYIIYTSGSTGRPKGVMVSHAGLLGVLKEQIALFNLGPESRSLFLLSIAFDASLSDIGTALLCGATLYIETGSRLETAARIQDIMTQRAITYVDLPPSLLVLLDPDHLPPCLHTITIGGEAVSEEVIKKFASRVRLINVYGPTEATICTSAVVCDAAENETDIGKPLNNMRYRVVDEHGENASMGELWISGPGLALGYLHNDTLNRERFIFQEGTRYYRTGDLVREKKGKIYFIGRIDRQVKVSGQLVAPEEIEAQLQAHESIIDAAVISIQNAIDSKTRLIAFIVTSKPLQEEHLRSYLKKHLPEWMIPYQFIFLDILPRNTSGKKDFGKLRKLIVESTTNQTTLETTDDLERQLLEIWNVTLNRQVGLDDNFFASGGDSLGVVQTVAMAEKNGLAIPIALMTPNVTIRSLASILRAHTDKTKSNGRLASDFTSDIKLTSAWKKLASTAVSLPLQTRESLFITGATGFLGSRLLSELLSQTKRPIIVLVRAASAKEGLEKILRTCVLYGFNLSAEDIKRIEVLTGDITSPHLGLTASAWQKLTLTVSEIYHCAATVNMVMSYEDLKKSNVNGVMEIVSFAMTGVRKKLNYASTLSVFVATDRNTGVAMEDDDLSKTHKIYGGYAQSKWVAERFLRQFSTDSLSCNIFRFGLITGDSVTGVHSTHDYLELFIRGLITLGCVPEGNHESLRLDVTPVDFAARAMAFIGQTSLSGCYHIANHGGFTLKMILEVLEKRGFVIKKEPSHTWLQKMKDRTLDSEASSSFAALCRLLPDQTSFERLRDMDLFQATNIFFDTTHTDTALSGTGIVIPPPNLTLLERYLDQILKNMKLPLAPERP
ncbi:amino acid adenylation domain-containing protein [Candidatus Uhrbacteria bacterium]|nr:amino acid adenylation domain-containing protein [Candidatus Uhrbacteria bacterium]